MRIGIACNSTYGGSGVVATELGAALARRGHTVHFISSDIPFRFGSHDFSGNIYFHEVETVDYPVLQGQLYGLALASKVLQVAEDEKLDLVHAHYAIPHGAGAWLGARMLAESGRKLRVVMTLHGTDITLVGRAPSFQPVVKFLLGQADAVTTVSDWLAAKTKREFNGGRPIEVIHNFIDPDRFVRRRLPDFRRKYAAPDEKIVLHISNFRPVKRVQDVVQVFARMVAPNNDASGNDGAGSVDGDNRPVKARLLMIGDGPERPCAMKVARDLGVADRVWFLGKQESIEEFLGIADLFLFPSEYESFGLAALEAMCCELPVVASRGGGLPEVIRDGETGFTCEVGDVAGMAAAGRRVLGDDALARRIGTTARADVSQRFHLDQIIPRYEAVYQRVLG